MSALEDQLETQYPDEDILLLAGFDEAFRGIAQRCASPLVAVYDREACVQLLVTRDGMTPDGALEYFEANIAGAYVGDRTPWFLENVTK